MIPFSFFFVSDITARFITLIFISSTSSDSMFPIYLTFHAATFSVSCSPSHFSFTRNMPSNTNLEEEEIVDAQETMAMR